ncbi:ATP-binding protein [Pelagibacteraceae bacterium]|nr:ATP-binding protein [Pelagibacteraceae bacterium]
MFNRFTQRIVSNWRFVAILLSAILLIITSFLILINQRSSVSNSNYLDEFLILLSAIFILTITIIFIVLVYRTIIPINKKKVASFNNRFSLYFISMALTPAVIAGILGLVLVNFGINDWFNDKIKSVINNSLNVAEGYVEEHNNSIKSDIYAMSNDLNRNYNVYINNRFTFEKYFQEQSIIRSLPEAYLIDNKGDVLMSRVYTLLTQYYRPRSEVIERAANGELAIMTSTTVNKVYALIKLPNFINAYLYVGRPLDPNVTKAFDETKSAITEYSNLESNRTQIAIVFMLIYILAILILIFVSTLIGIRFAKRIVKPITNVIDATKSIKEGSFDINLPQSNEFIELNRLSESFNAMSSELSVQRNLLANSEKHAAWSEIAKTIAHEIKNPLTPIQLSNDRIRKKLEDIKVNDPIITECLNIISRQVGDIGKLVNDFSNFARMPKPIFAHNSLKIIIQNCVQSKSLENQDKIRFLVNCDDNLIINCDKLQLTQVFNNIIQNSMNSILENNVLNGVIDIDVHKNNSKVIVQVKDNGVGIVNSKSELIEPYFSTRKKTGGTGLGLSIVNKIITDHDGILELKNNSDNGLCVKITFNKLI